MYRVLQGSCARKLRMMDPEGEVPWRSKEVTGAAAPQCYVQEKQTFSQIFNILRSSYDALDGLPGSD